jgi:hypothetical protein
MISNEAGLLLTRQVRRDQPGKSVQGKGAAHPFMNCYMQHATDVIPDISSNRGKFIQLSLDYSALARQETASQHETPNPSLTSQCDSKNRAMSSLTSEAQRASDVDRNPRFDLRTIF